MKNNKENNKNISENINPYLKEIPQYLYKFYSFDNKRKMNSKKLKTLMNKKIWMGSYKNQNDPFELKNLEYQEINTKDKNVLELSKKLKRAINAIKNSIKFSSLTNSMEDNVSMWSYYTNNYQGFACKFKVVNNIRNYNNPILPVVYEDTPNVINEKLIEDVFKIGKKLNRSPNTIKNSTINETVKYLFKVLACCKGKSWEHEKEFRLIYFGDNSNFGVELSFDELNLELDSIYIGLKCKKKYKKKLITISNMLNVKCYEIEKSDKEFKFIAKELKKE